MVVLNPTVVDRQQSRIDLTQRLILEMAAIRGMLGEFQIYESFAVELPRVDALFAGANVNILVLQVQPCDVVYFPADRLLFGARGGLAEGVRAQGERTGGVGRVGTAAEHRYNFIMRELFMDVSWEVKVVPRCDAMMDLQLNSSAYLQKSVLKLIAEQFLQQVLRIIMHKNSREPLNSELTEQQRNNSLRSFKTEEYQSKIYELSNQVKLLRQRLLSLENQHPRENQPQQQYHSLQVENARLQRENKALRIKVQELQTKLRSSTPEQCQLASVKSLGNIKKSSPQQVASRQSSKAESRLTATTTHLLRELLAECNQPSECISATKNEKLKDEFYEFKDSADCFEPWLSQLSKQEKIRLKRCLTREKELLWTSSHAELGCISPYNPSNSDSPQFSRLLLVLTNISPHSLCRIRFSPLFAKDIEIVRQGQQVQGKWQYAGLDFNQQIKQELLVTVNNVDFRCVQLELSFETQGETYQTLLILPISKVKLFRHVAYSVSPPKSQRIERVFEFERRVLSGVDRLGKLWQLVEGGEKVGRKYYWKISFLGRLFWVQASAVEEKMMVGVRFQSERALAEKILEQYIFLFKKL